jgi:hypothetical protein
MGRDRLTGLVEWSLGREIGHDPAGRGDRPIMSASTGSSHTQKGTNDAKGQERPRTDADRAQFTVSLSAGCKNCDKNLLILENISPGRSSFIELSTYVYLVVWVIIIQITLYLYFGDTYMTNVASNATAAKSETAAETKQILLA